MRKKISLLVLIIGVIALFINLTILIRQELLVEKIISETEKSKVEIEAQYSYCEKISEKYQAYCTSTLQQIEIQQVEAKMTKPQKSQVKNMIKDGTLCYHNDDCRHYPSELKDCNSERHFNKYYCLANKDECFTTLVACPANEYYLCSDNKCTRKELPVKYPTQVF